ATQAISWNVPTNNGGLPISQQRVWQCSTSTLSTCTNASAGWTQVGSTMSATANNTTNLCAPSGYCSYEVWAENGIGRGWNIGKSQPSGPEQLQATASNASPGRIDLSWIFNGSNQGNGLGHYVLFECDSTLVCTNGTWTNV